MSDNVHNPKHYQGRKLFHNREPCKWAFVEIYLATIITERIKMLEY